MHGPDASGAADDRRRHGAGQLGAETPDRLRARLVLIGLGLAVILVVVGARLQRALLKAQLHVVDGRKTADGG